MKATIDTNILVRMFTQDDPVDSPVAETFFRENEVVVANQTLCEMVWVLRRVYRFTIADLRQALIALRDAHSVTLDDQAVALGLSFLDAGGDFADGVIVFEGGRLGGTSYATFDRKAVAIAHRNGLPAHLLKAQG